MVLPETVRRVKFQAPPTANKGQMFHYTPNAHLVEHGFTDDGVITIDKNGEFSVNLFNEGESVFLLSEKDLVGMLQPV